MLVRWLLALLTVLGVAAQVVEPLGEALSDTSYLGGSFAAFIALVLFDAITGADRPQEVTGATLLESVDELAGRVNLAFQAKHVKVDFIGFTTETLVRQLQFPMEQLTRNPGGTRSVEIRVLLPFLGNPMNYPCAIRESLDSEGRVGYVFEDSPENRRRMEDYAGRHVSELIQLVRDVRNSPFGELGSDENRGGSVRVDLKIRHSPLQPQFKQINLNDEDYYFSYYQIVDKVLPGSGGDLRILDAHALRRGADGAQVIGWSRKSESVTTRNIAEHHSAFFENAWNHFGGLRPATENGRA